MPKDQQSSSFRSRRHPDYYARASWNDYTGRRIYLVTFNINPQAPRLSKIIEIKNQQSQNQQSQTQPSRSLLQAEARLTDAGRAVADAIRITADHYPQMQIIRYVIMPDHCHFVIFVKQKTDKSLGNIVASLKGNATRLLRQRFPEHPFSISGNPLFEGGFNDKIVYRKNQLENFIRYVEDNPRRLLLRCRLSNFFNRRPHIEIDGRIYETFGNFLLLRNPVMEPVRISRRYTAEQLEQHYRRWDEVIRGHGALVSPFISPQEKEIRDAGIENGAAIIRIQREGLPERYKPTGQEFELCAEGRLLIICMRPYDTRKSMLTRADCMEMNSLADKISCGNFKAKLIRNKINPDTIN